jgi:hypothetical protein
VQIVEGLPTGFRVKGQRDHRPRGVFGVDHAGPAQQLRRAAQLDLPVDHERGPALGRHGHADITTAEALGADGPPDQIGQCGDRHPGPTLSDRSVHLVCTFS